MDKLIQAPPLTEEEDHQLARVANWLAENLEATGLRGREIVSAYHSLTGRVLTDADLFAFLLDVLVNLQGGLPTYSGPARLRIGEFVKLWNGAIPAMGRHVGWLRERIRTLEAGEVEVISRDFTVEGVADLIEKKLRTCVRGRVLNEKQVQEALEMLLGISEILTHREQRGIPVGSKMTKPDFTIEALSLAVEVKLVKAAADEARVIREISADIQGYQQEYPHLLFVVYDLGVIRDFDRFKSGLASARIRLILVKH